MAARGDLLTQEGGYDAMPPDIQRVYRNAVDYIASRYQKPSDIIPLTKKERTMLAKKRAQCIPIATKKPKKMGVVDSA